MEIPVLNRITDFESGIGTFQNPPYISQTISISGFVAASKWTALLLVAFAAAFSGLLNRLRILAVKIRQATPPPDDHQPLLDGGGSDSDTSCSTDDDDEDEDFEEEEAEVDASWRRRVDEDFRVRSSGSCVDDQYWQSRKLRLRHRRSVGDIFSWNDLAAGKSVVKLYLPAVSAPVVVTAGENDPRNIELKVWDRRVSCRIPAIIADWHSQSKKIVDFSASGLERLIVGGDGELTVGDLRKANAPLEYVRGLGADTWWDADAVKMTDNFFDSFAGESYDSAVARCCDALRSHLVLGVDKKV